MTDAFDHVIDRRGTDSYKWQRYAGRDILPMWVADMDFASPPAVLDAIQRRTAHGIFGYSGPTRSVVESVMAMLEQEYGWRIEAEWLVWTPGLEVALNVACRLIERERDGVLTTVPAYPPFLQAPRFTARMLRSHTLVDNGQRFGFDFDRFIDDFDPLTRLFLFCHPQNPTGRAWTRPELERVAEVCLQQGVMVCSDEIHNGLILEPDRPHLPFAMVSPDLAARTITLMSPSKTFNLAGLMCAYAIIPDRTLRRSFQQAARGIITELNAFGFVACEAAYRHGAAWRLELLDYLRGNRDRVEAAVARMPGLSMRHVEATYLAWIDCRGAHLEHPAAFFEAAGVGLSDGVAFGAPGFARLNFGCPRATLDEALARMARALPEQNRN